MFDNKIVGDCELCNYIAMALPNFMVSEVIIHTDLNVAFSDQKEIP